ncbi:abortive infection family protein [Bradyrhizobium sp. URHD0069]|uniref:abortive infection family protein n=1 Tax=Bradyrhizobium sp. URHD0069 TaxID=1380355 RepID=UPI000495986D|nr:abortive infection family protein [Bradyrhizobium sp. URHD0069]
MSDFPDTPREQAKSLENVLLAACRGDRSSTGFYQQLRTELMQDSVLKPLLPEFVRTGRDLSHFWGYIKPYSPHWAPRETHVRDAMTPLINYLEGANAAPVDNVATDVLQKFDADGVHIVWQKALDRRHTDPDGAITSARTLLETVCKRILDEASETYSDKDDLPALYRAVAMNLQIAPSQHTEDAFKRILGGVTSVVEGLGSLRNKIGDAHGQGGKPVRPSARHAQLAVNLAGAMATFLVDTWIARNT